MALTGLPRSPVKYSTGIINGDSLGLDKVSLVKLENNMQAFFRPDGGHVMFDNEGMPRGELIAYETSQALGFKGLVPPTVLRSLGGHQGTLQLAASGREGDFFIKDGVLPASLKDETIAHAAAFDHILHNGDRHSSNYLITSNNRLHLIDHEYILTHTEGGSGESDFLRNARLRNLKLAPYMGAFKTHRQDVFSAVKKTGGNEIAQLVLDRIDRMLATAARGGDFEDL